MFELNTTGLLYTSKSSILCYVNFTLIVKSMCIVGRDVVEFEFKSWGDRA